MISEIVKKVKHVVLYRLQDSQWEQMDIEGSLFLYKRTDGKHAFIIVNRKKLEHHVVILDGIQFQVDDSFLFYKDAEDRTFGLWFFEQLSEFYEAVLSLDQSTLSDLLASAVKKSWQDHFPSNLSIEEFRNTLEQKLEEQDFISKLFLDYCSQ